MQKKIECWKLKTFVSNPRVNLDSILGKHKYSTCTCTIQFLKFHFKLKHNMKQYCFTWNKTTYEPLAFFCHLFSMLKALGLWGNMMSFPVDWASSLAISWRLQMTSADRTGSRLQKGQKVKGHQHTTKHNIHVQNLILA